MTERTFDILETCCFPKGCLVPKDHQPYLATVLVPQLEAAGMKTAEWTRGALLLEEPYLTSVKGIVCRQCGIRECTFNPRFKPSDDFSDLMDGQYADRLKKGDDLLAQLLPDTKRAELEQAGVKVCAIQMASRKNPKLIFAFSCGDKNQSIRCYVGTRRLLTNEGEKQLSSFEQVAKEIQSAIHALV